MKMEGLHMFLAILNLCGVMRTMLTPPLQYNSFQADNGIVDCPSVTFCNQWSEIFTTFQEIQKLSLYDPYLCQYADQCTSLVGYYNQNIVNSMCYTRDDYWWINKNNVTKTISSVLTTFGFRKPVDQVCVKIRKYKRGKRAGHRKQRKITVVTTHRAVQSYDPSFKPNYQDTKKQKQKQNQTKVQQNLIKIVTKQNEKTEDNCDVKCMLYNVQSFGEKSVLLNDLIVDEKVDLVFFTESWQKPEGDEVRLHTVSPPNFVPVSFPRLSGRRGGGICVLSRNSMTCNSSRIPDYPTFECTKSDVVLNGTNIMFVCIYRPPPSTVNGLTTVGFLSDFQDFLDTLTFLNKEVLIVGDINLHFDEPNDRYVKKMIDILSARNLIQIVNKPTHRNGHIIDWIIVDAQNTKLFNVNVLDKALSDHFVVTFDLNLKKPDSKVRKVKCRNIKAIDFNLFQKDLKERITNISHAVDFNDVTRAVLDIHAPLRDRKVTVRNSAPWMTKEIKIAKAERRQAERKWRSSGHQLVFKNIYRLFHTKVKELIIAAKRMFYTNKIANCPSSKALFDIVQAMCGKSKSTTYPNAMSLVELSNKFATYFTDKVATIRGNLDLKNKPRPSFGLFEGKMMDHFEIISPEDVKDIILSSPPKSCSLDSIPTPLLIKNIDILVASITKIINDSLQSGTVPPCFKHAVVSPLLKKPNLDPEDLKNYRPVSNLSFLSKILEKCVFRQTFSHIEEHGLLEVHQSAYRKFHNTETALLKIHNDLLTSADEGNISVLTLLDLSAAFDTIDHSILIERLEKTFGLSGTVLNWFISYLSNRTQCVTIEGEISLTHNLSFGVPQGSVLGPFLYTLYTTPLGSIIRNHNLSHHMYADDTQLYLSCPPSELNHEITKMEECINDVKEWMLENKLKLNDDKTEALLCDAKSLVTSDVTSLRIGEENIDFSTKAKNLGVLFDEKLSMLPQVNNLCKLLFLELRRIGQMASVLNESSLKTLISSCVFSKIDYCNSLLFNLPNEVIDKLQRLQNQAARLVLRRSCREHVTPMLIQLHWLPVKARLTYKTCMLCYKCRHGLAPSYLSELLEEYIPARTLRSQDKKLFRERDRKNVSSRIGARAFSVFAPTEWNSLPLSLKSSESILTFKKDLKTYLFKKHFTNC